MEEDPKIAAALKDISEVSSSLAALNPQTESTAAAVPSNINAAPRKWIIGGALAASIAFLATFMQVSQDPRDLLALHSEYMDTTYDLSSSNIQLIATNAGAYQPDLTRASLTAVARSITEHETVIHYSGKNGCRLTYLRGTVTYQLPSKSDVQVMSWTKPDGQVHAIIATGMDAARFDAIGNYLRHLNAQQEEPQVYAELTQATKAATPCVG
ncbi:hypothetical protein RKLH11_1558 [Rhodobacteraceae bacterium KLH11]|nr:hypothetical protein RKLH11_1558 [Rhodobacteraceae bacterium KLH11]